MALQPSLIAPMERGGTMPERRFLALYLPHWPTDYLKRHEPGLCAPMALYECIKGGLRLAALDGAAMRLGLREGQNLADARALVPRLTVRELKRESLAAHFAEFADWHSNASPLVSILTDAAPYGDLMLDITGVSHLFGGEAAMLRMLLNRLRTLDYTVAGAIAPTIGAAWGVSHYARSQVVNAASLESVLDALPIHALRLDEKQISMLNQMGLTHIGHLRSRPRKPLQARFGASLLLRLDQAYGESEERMTPRLPPIDHAVERRFADPIALMDDVLATTHDLAVQLACHLEAHGLGAQTFHLFLYRVDHKMMTLSLNAARVTRDPVHITDLFRHRAQRLEGEYDAGFGIDMVRLAASALDRLDPAQAGAFANCDGIEELDRLLDRLGSRLGSKAVLRSELVASHIPERAVRLEPAVTAQSRVPENAPALLRPLRLLPMPERVAINAEVPDGLPASMIWRRQSYRLVKAAGPERLGAEWWRSGQRLKLVEEEEEEKSGQAALPPNLPREGGGAASSAEQNLSTNTGPTPSPSRGKLERGDEKPDLKNMDHTPASAKPPPYIPDLPVFDPEAGTRNYYVVEDEEGARFWIFRQGMHQKDAPAPWYLHGLFA